MLSEESIRVLRALHQNGARLLGRLDRDIPFLLTGSVEMEVPAAIPNELFEAGLIRIDEAAPKGAASGERYEDMTAVNH